jgi:replicative DNA helicase
METFDQIEQDKKLAEYDGPDKVVSAAVILDKIRKGPKKEPFKAGLGNLDNAIGGGFFPGDLVVISGVTGEGKTTLAKTLIKQFLEKNVAAPLCFSYEGDHEDFLGTFEKYDKASLKIIFMPLTLEKHDLAFVDQRIRESILKYKTKIVVIDHLHRLLDLYSRESTTEQIGKIVVRLKELAVKHQMVMLLLCHVGLDAFKNAGEPGLGSVRDSGLIESEADTVFYVFRFDDEGVTLVKVAKNRHGGKKNIRIPLMFSEMSGMYIELSPEDFDEAAVHKAARERSNQEANRGKPRYGKRR